MTAFSSATAGDELQRSILNGTDPPLLAQATQADLLGLVALYTIRLYGPPPLDRARMLSAEVPKALRIDVAYEADLQRPVLIDWQQELIPPLQPPAAAVHFRGAFAALKRNDVVAIEYAPRTGTSVRVNESVAVSGAHHELMLAFLDHWIGQRPVSEEMKRHLLGLPQDRGSTQAHASRPRSWREARAARGGRPWCR